MKRALIIFLLIVGVAALSDELKPAAATPSEVVHVATALDHLTVLEFGEPVTMAASGSQAFQIERHDDKVFIKPLKASASTDLFVWTATRRFAYELESSTEVKNMNFSIDARLPAPKPLPDSSGHLDEIADMMLTRAFLSAQAVDSTLVKDVKDGVTVRVEQVLESKNTLYIHFTVVNRGGQPYRVAPQTVEQVVPLHPGISLPALRYQQLSRSLYGKLAHGRTQALTVANAQIANADLVAGQSTQGIVAIRQKPDSPSVLKLTFGTDGKAPVEAYLVF
jgi:hypothetical protein